MHVYNRLEEKKSVDERIEAGHGFKGGQEHRGRMAKNKTWGRKGAGVK